MSTFIWTPAPGASEENKPRVKVAVFGDGYQQRVGNGINTIARIWSVQFNRSTSDIDAISAFLAARMGVESFIWTPPAGVAGKWLCPDWTRTIRARNAQSISTTFEEIFGD